jgi:hypothetical protein
VQALAVVLVAMLVLIYTFGAAVVLSAYAYSRVYPDAVINVLLKVPPAAPPEDGGPPAQAEDGDAAEHGTDVPDIHAVAVPGYFHEIALRDMRRVIRTATATFVSTYGTRHRRAKPLFENASPTLASMSAAGSGAGEFLGALFGSVAFLFTGIAHLLVTGLAVGLVRVAGRPLRLFDRAVRKLTDRDISTCQACGERVHPYPVYLCPRCGRAHRDIRPGRYGVARRVCRCGKRFPTLIVLGAWRLKAIGPACGHPLPRGVGSVPEIVWAFTGSVNTGKTRLLYSIAQHVKDLAEDSGGKTEPIGDTADRLSEIETSIADTGDTRPTPPAAETSGYGLRLLLRGGQRLLYLFDPAGELNYSSTRGLAQRHLPQTRALLLVIDPLAVERFWANLPPADRQFLSRYRSDARTDTLAFETTCECLRQIGARTRKIPLAIVLSRADLLDRTTAADRWRDLDARTWMSDPDWLDLGNVLRYAEMNFKVVKLFRTSAAVPDGTADAGVRELTRWLMGHAAISFHGPAHA